MIKVKKNEILFIYNTDKFRDREALGYVSALNNPRVKNIDLKKDPLTMQQIGDVAMSMGVNPQQLVEEDYKNKIKEKFSGKDLLENEDVLKYMQKNPEVIKTPIIVTHDSAYVVDSPYDFIKENMAVKSTAKKHL